MQEGLLLALVRAEVVGSQRAGLGIDVVDSLIKVVVGTDRQQRPKDFLFHAERVTLRRYDQRGWDLARAIAEVLICGVQRDDATAPLLGILKVAAETLVVTLVITEVY